VIDAAKNAAKKGMTIYTVGVGSPDGATMPIRYQNGRTDFVRDSSGQVVKTQLDEETLKKIAEETRGLYVPLGRGAEGLDTIYQERLSLVPKSELDQRMERVALERFEWPLALALGLLIFEFFMGERRQAKPARELPSVARRVNPLPRVVSLAWIGLLVFSQVAETRAADAKTGVDSQQSYNKGTDAYGKGDFTAAADALRISLRTPDLALQQRAYYNLGNSLYRAGQGSLEKDPDATVRSWEAAVKAYDDVLALNAGDSDALFNKELVARKLDELKKQQEQEKKQDPSKDEDKKDEDKKDEDKKDEDKKDEDKKDEDKKDEDKKDEDKKDGDKKGEDGKESKDGEESKDGKEDGSEGKDEKEGKEPGKDGDSKDAKDTKDGKEGEKREPGEEAKDSETGKDEGDKQAGEQEAGEKDADGKDAGAIEEARAQKQEMTPEEAKQLLDSLRSDERMVVPIPQPQRGRFTTDQTIKGKTW
jgi:Ca-activated chloride channel family protein